MLLKLHNIYAGYDGGDVLRGIDIEVEQGTTTCIIGLNGAGKSTLLRVVSGLLKPRMGEVIFASRSLNGMTPHQILSLGIVQVPQTHSLFPSMTVRENVRLGTYLLNDSARIECRLHEVEALFPIVKTHAREKAGSLSGGQQRMVEFARSLMLDPQVILLDEPSMGLDPQTFKQVIKTVEEMQRSGRTIVLIEQNARTGLGLANNGIVLESGRVRLTGSPANILNNPEIAHLYLGGMLSHG